MSATIVLAGGCFWGVQGVFQRVNGVLQAVSGYSGGARETAHYEMVGSGLTGHAESVKITYDPKKVSYGTLLQIYFSVAHDPTQLTRTAARSTVRPSSTPTRRRRKRPKNTSPSSMPPRPTRRRSSPRSCRWSRSIPPRTITRTT
jgi:peptide-methionine (S)-S-oxide reductase